MNLFTIIRAWEKTRTVAANIELMSSIDKEVVLNIDDRFSLFIKQQWQNWTRRRAMFTKQQIVIFFISEFKLTNYPSF
jgi:hypothetical protein